MRKLALEGVRRRLRLPCRRAPMRVAAGVIGAGAARPKKAAKKKAAKKSAAKKSAAKKSAVARFAVACEDQLLVLDKRGVVIARAGAQGWPQVIAIADLGRGGEVIAGFGISRRRRQASAVLSRYRLVGEKLEASALYSPKTTRNELSALVVERSGARWSLIVGAYESKYIVKHVRLAPAGKRAAGKDGAGGGVAVKPIGAWRMATSHALARIGGKRLSIVGRIYGDTRSLPGDAFIWSGGKRLRLPTVRGARAVAALRLAGAKDDALLVADGWAQNYGRDARALLGLVRRDKNKPAKGSAASKYKRATIAKLEGEYAIMRMHVVDVDHDGKPEVLLLGSHSTRLLRHVNGTWRAHTVGGRAADATAVDLDGDKLDELILVGAPSTIVDLRKVLR